MAQLRTSKLLVTSRKTSWIVVLLSVLLNGLMGTPMWADISLPLLFSDHMVLQRGDSIRLWGESADEEVISVTLAGATVEATIAEDGSWAVDLPAPEGSGPFDLEIVGSASTVVLNDVLIGEVWVCSGQSNMEWPLSKTTGGEEAIAKSANPNLRLFHVPHQASEDPLDEFLQPVSWMPCGETTTGDFSAVAYYFGRHLQQELDCPVGLILTSVGGTCAEAWTPRTALEDDPENRFAPMLEHWDSLQDRGDSKHHPGYLYNGMVAPLTKIPIQGVIWYQGESNVGRGHQYATLFPTLIQSWRTAFANDELPFYYVNIAPFRYTNHFPSALPEIWDAQMKTLSLENTGMVTISDFANVKDIHPPIKAPVGQRLARMALLKTYQREASAATGPLYREHRIDGERIFVAFDNVGDGLKARDAQPLKHFQICGDDREFVDATATVEDNGVWVFSDQVGEPVAVRFAWKDTAIPNLLNSDGIPAAPFRTDDFDLISKDEKF